MPGMLPGYCETFVSRSRNRGLVLLDFCGNECVKKSTPVKLDKFQGKSYYYKKV